MKKTILVIFSLLSIGLVSQDTLTKSYPRNEIKINVLYLLLGLPELTYERALNQFSSVGVSVFYGAARNVNVGLGIFPFYRWYFGQKKPVCGFFLEGNGGLYAQDVTNYTSFNWTTRKEIQGGLGLGLGGKFEVHKVWTAEILWGLGRNFINSGNMNDNEIYPRIGISIGRRF